MTAMGRERLSPLPGSGTEQQDCISGELREGIEELDVPEVVPDDDSAAEVLLPRLAR